jgi:hypothetical protein
MVDELVNFKLKADEYKAALRDSPYSRILELYPALFLLFLHAKTISKPVSKLRILDLMSGSGFLAENLLRCGFEDLTAIEFCEQMYSDVPLFNNDVRLHRINSFESLQGALEDIKPDIIISLASFHHLIIYSSDGTINRDESVGFQTKIIDTCMAALPFNGLMIILDLIEDNIQRGIKLPREFRSSMAPVGWALKAYEIEHSIGEIFNKAKTIDDVSSYLRKNNMRKTGNLSLRWFREIVDNKTSIGHKDMAISRSLVSNLISRYNTFIQPYNCPWVFSSKDLFNNFFYKKFGFSLNRNEESSQTKSQIANDAEEILGTKYIHKGTSDYYFIGWNLGVIAIWTNDPIASTHQFRRILYSLTAIIVLFLVAHILRFGIGTYISFSPENFLLTSLTLVVGLLIADIWKYFNSGDR